MSLTALARGFVFAVLAVFAAYSGWAWAVPAARYVLEARESTARDLRIASRTLAYRFQGQRPLEFVFSQPVERVRILAQAAVQPGSKAAGAAYTLRIALFDATGDQLAQYDQSLLSGRADGQFADGAARRFYRGGDSEIWSQDQVIAHHQVPFTKVVVTLVAADSIIDGVDLRAYERRPVMAGDEQDIFLRRNAGERAALAAFSPFPPDMLTDDEVRNLAVNLWRPVGPLGIEGRDYRALVIYAAARGDRDADQ